MRGVLGFVGQVLAWAVILLAGTAIVLAVLLPRLGGATPYTVLTGSMRPHYPPGTLVVARPIDPEKLMVGDVVTYQLRSGEPEVVTHRIVQIATTLDGQRTFQTQGDANNVADKAWVLPVQVRGKLWYAVPFLGRLNIVFTGPEHQWLVYAVAALLAGYALVMFAAAARDRLRRTRGSASPARRHRQEVDA